MKEKIKEIIAPFLKKEKTTIDENTIIDRSVLGSSIIVHRMFAKLAAEGVVVQNYQQVKTFGNLLQNLAINYTENINSDLNQKGDKHPAITPVHADLLLLGKAAGVGIDMEEVSSFPPAIDFRTHEFYKMNFSISEIAYCILQPNPYQSFAGLFAAKEAIIKADNTYQSVQFNNIPIQHSSTGKPYHPAFFISISHTDTNAVAIAVPITFRNQELPMAAASLPLSSNKNSGTLIWAAVIVSLLMAAYALFKAF
jgi:phosphopantetheine--protein transferase-like protein